MSFFNKKIVFCWFAAGPYTTSYYWFQMEIANDFYGQWKAVERSHGGLGPWQGCCRKWIQFARWRLHSLARRICLRRPLLRRTLYPKTEVTWKTPTGDFSKWWPNVVENKTMTCNCILVNCQMIQRFFDFLNNKILPKHCKLFRKCPPIRDIGKINQLLNPCFRKTRNSNLSIVCRGEQVSMIHEAFEAFRQLLQSEKSNELTLENNQLQ